MKRILVAIVSLVFILPGAGAQDVTPLSLKDCMDYAMKHNYSVKNAQIDVLIQQAQNNQTLSASMPHVNGKADFNDFYLPQQSFIEGNTFQPTIPKGIIVPIAFTLPYSSSVGITASQLIFDGSVFVAVKARNSVMELAKLNGKVTEETVCYNVYKAYNSLVIAYRQYDIIKKSLVYARSMQHDAEVLKASGFAEKIDVDRGNVQINNLATDSMRIANLLDVSEQVLKFQIGMELNKRIVLTDTVVSDRKETTMSLVNEPEHYENVLTYQQLKMALKLNEYNLNRYEMSALPTLSAFWAYGSNYGALHAGDLKSFDKWLPNSTIGLSLTVPIFNGFLRKNQVTEAKLNIEKTKNNIEAVKQGIDFQVSTSRTSLKNAILQTQSQHRNLDLSNDVLELAQKKYKAGVGSSMEVTQAQTEMLRAQNNYFSALLDIINAEADLKKSLGLMKP